MHKIGIFLTLFFILALCENYPYTYENLFISSEAHTWQQTYRLDKIDKVTLDIHADRGDYSITFVCYYRENYYNSTYVIAYVKDYYAHFSITEFANRCYIIIWITSPFKPNDLKPLLILNMTITVSGDNYLPVPSQNLPIDSSVPMAPPMASPLPIAPSPHDSQLKPGVIIGIVIGIAAVIAIGIFVTFMVRKKLGFNRD